MYATYNMGAGFALILEPKSVPIVIQIAERLGITAMHAGYVEKRGRQKKVVLVEKDIEYDESTLAIR